MRVRDMLLKLLRKIGVRTGRSYWRQRAAKYGIRAVLNLAHSPEAVLEVTEFQKGILFPIFTAALIGSERAVLDFGCGPGRFTGDLARILKGRAVGIDPIRGLLELAPKEPNVTYMELPASGTIPCDAGAFDAVWVCLVLGAIPDDSALARTMLEIDRVLAPHGLLFVVENTARKASSEFWRFRSIEAYKSALRFANAEVVGSYEDAGEAITVFAGRKCASSSRSLITG